MQRIIPFLVGLLIVLGIGSTMVFTVDQRQYALVFALGEVRQVVTQPGLHFKLPPPFQNVVYFDNRILTIDTPDVDRFITAEKLNIMLDSFVKWRIADPRQFYVSVGGSELIAGDRISRSLRDALNNEIARNTVADVISGERQEMLDRVRTRVSEDMKTIGADVIDVRLKRVDFAPEVSERVFDRMQSERKRVANERRATGAAESERIRADADRQREVIVAEAYRDAQRVRGEGDAQATALYAEAFGKNPEFAEFYRSLDAYRNSFRSRNDLLVLDPSAEFFKYFRSSADPGVRDPLAPRDPPATAARDARAPAADVAGTPAGGTAPAAAVAREPAVPTRIR
ncbi:MAG TPA: protease modulator HflC [Burkholderiaceae bacterium]|nr:protease modulator HflC [Burkholderiaceae bacterium]